MQPNLPQTIALVLAALQAACSPPARAAEQSVAGGDGVSQQAAIDAPETMDSPRAALQAFLDACRDGDYARAARYLDLGAAAEHEGPLLAKRLKVVLDRTAWINLESLSGTPEGDMEDGLRPQLERVVTIGTAKGPFDLVLRREPLAEVPWRFSPATVAHIPDLYDEFGYGALGDLLPDEFFRLTLLEVQLWQWIGLLLLIVFAFVASWAIVWLLYSILRQLVVRTSSQVDDQILELVAKPARFAVALALFSFGVLLLRLALPVQRFIVGLEKGLGVAVFAWILLRLIDVLGRIMKDRLNREGKFGAVSVLPLGEKTVKVVVLAFAFLALLQNLGFDATGLIAGLGIGGLAFALAAQKTIENLFGGVSVITDQPVRVGEFCRFGDHLGTVEDIGLRSTRVRTIDRTILSVPNAEFAAMQIENFGRRDKIRFSTTLGLRYETTPDQLRWVLAEIRKLLLSHPRVDPDPARVRFVKYGDFSLDVEIFSYVRTTDINDYLAVQEDLLLRLMDIVADSGTGFAFPSNTTYIARDSGLDEERKQEAETSVAKWRQRGEVPLPDYAVEVRDRLAGSLDYPPSGSALWQPKVKS
jgi:MscS family membrane protein